MRSATCNGFTLFLHLYLSVDTDYNRYKQISGSIIKQSNHLALPHYDRNNHSRDCRQHWGYSLQHMDIHRKNRDAKNDISQPVVYMTIDFIA